MEALELYRSESRKLEEHKYACENAGKQVHHSLSPSLTSPAGLATACEHFCLDSSRKIKEGLAKPC